jgi:hypothetical protein
MHRALTHELIAVTLTDPQIKGEKAVTDAINRRTQPTGRNKTRRITQDRHRWSQNTRHVAVVS